MPEPAHIARYLHSAGGDLHPNDAKLFYIKGRTLTCKKWNGESFSDEKVVTSNVRPGSTAAFLDAKDTSRHIVYISSESALRVSHYNEEDQKWVDDEEAGILEPSTVHSKGALAVCQGNVIFQDRSRHLVFVDESWQRTTLPTNAVTGTPLATLFEEGKTNVFYVSAGEDKRFHRVTQDESGGWSDTVVTDFPIHGTPKRILVARNSEEAFEIYQLTKDKELNLVTDDGPAELLGIVTDEGELQKLDFTPIIPISHHVVKSYFAPSSSGVSKADAKKKGEIVYY